jgi:hypothetical protein
MAVPRLHDPRPDRDDGDNPRAAQHADVLNLADQVLDGVAHAPRRIDHGELLAGSFIEEIDSGAQLPWRAGLSVEPDIPILSRNVSIQLVNIDRIIRGDEDALDVLPL